MQIISLTKITSLDVKALSSILLLPRETGNKIDCFVVSNLLGEAMYIGILCIDRVPTFWGDIRMTLAGDWGAVVVTLLVDASPARAWGLK